MTEVIGLPTVDSVMDTIPTGRRAYISATTDLGNGEVIKDAWGHSIGVIVNALGLVSAVRTLAEASLKDELVPPLPDDLKTILVTFKDVIDRHKNDTFAAEELHTKYRVPAELAVRAALDHGSNAHQRAISRDQTVFPVSPDAIQF